ncbi:MAG: ABC transporter ATP-binding protein [Rhodoplanes sp.]|uniref:ABC transporter ATP-binding protein n=1 Tax=Rhodoplanes sp. TaxID=1968906 RepID=UPI00182AD4AE|nr:ABC transporter ATP-binding protein [Rhodoplanes sp.]NVO12945.1 ABC transporter ATP-binding protein [Rhodoplanes sp.]
MAQAVRAPDTDPAAGPPAIEVLGADKVFGNGTRALAPIDLTVDQGEFVTLLGPSGCGKSTLLKMVANLIEPTSGGLMWWGRDYDHVGQAGRKLVFVFQDPTLMPWSRVRSNVRLPLDLAGTPKQEGDARVDQALAMVGLSRFDGCYPRELSGGMQMRVSIARALVTEPNLLLMDEPFGALDEITRNKLDQDLLDLWFQKKLTVVFVTHSIYESVFLSTRVVVMAARPGRVLRELIIDEPYPRDDAFRVSQKFAAYARDLQVLLAEASISGAPHI